MVLHDRRRAWFPVVDTHSVVGFLQRDEHLSRRARADINNALAAGHPILVPSISLVELVYLVEKGRIPAAAAERVDQVLRDPAFGFRIARLDLSIEEATRHVPRSAVPDPPDRVIAATALALHLPLVTGDRKIRVAKIQTIW